MHRIVLISPLILLYFSSIAQPNEMNISYDSSAQVHAFDSTAKLRVNQIIITGNRKTKDYIILREMHIKAGDMIKIDKLNYELEKAKEYVYNTTLFVEVTVEPLVKNAFEIDILVTVKERWYIFPLPIFELVDRTFNEWIVKHNGSLDRVNYGLRFTDNNVSGRKDEFRLNLINGYTKQASIYYDQPYANPSLTNGFNVGAGFEKNREMAYKTDYNNYFQYYNKPGFVEDSWFVSAGFAIRKAIKKKHIFNLRYSHITVADSVITENLNPRYFNTNSSGKGFIDFSYSYRYTDVNNILYPLSGVTGSFTVQKRGLGLSGGINMFSVDGSYNRYWGLGKKWYASTEVNGKIKLPFNEAFINQRALGDGNNYLRGLEYYVIDGYAFALAKFNLKKEILHFNVPTFLRSKIYNKIPFRIYAKTFTDLGEAFNKYEGPTRLNNKILYTGGFGIDILTLYDIQIKLEYSLNQLGQKGLFLHNQ